MHNKILKGIASVLSAALVLGSVITSVVPAKAVTSVKGDDGYETTYALSELELAYIPEGDATLDGNKIVYTKRYANCIFKIPQEVLDAGFTAYYINGSSEGDAGVDMKIIIVEKWWENGKCVDNYGGAYSRDTATRVDTSWNPDGISFMSLGDVDDISVTTTIDGVIFITEKSVGDAADPGTTTPDPGTGSETPSAEASTTNAYTLTQLKEGTHQEGVSVSGNSITFAPSGDWSKAFFAVPQEVIDGGLVSLTFNSDATDFVLVYTDENQVDVDGNVFFTYSGTSGNSFNFSDKDPEKVAKVRYIAISGNSSATFNVENITFTTEKAVTPVISAPETTDPGTTDPGTTDPGTTDPGTTDPGTTDPGTTDPGTSVTAPGTAKISKLTPAKKKMTVKWAKVADASEYVVYRSDKKNGEYEKIATTTKAKYVDKTVKSKTKYFYKVQAVNEAGAGDLSAAKGKKTK